MRSVPSWMTSWARGKGGCLHQHARTTSRGRGPKAAFRLVPEHGAKARVPHPDVLAGLGRVVRLFLREAVLQEQACLGLVGGGDTVDLTARCCDVVAASHVQSLLDDLDLVAACAELHGDPR